MSDIKFEILYQSKTLFVILNKEENDNNLFNKFIEQLKKELNIIDANKKAIFKIMALNAKEMYLIVNEENFSNIIKEKAKNEIIKLFLDIEFLDEKKEIKNENKKIDEDDDFNEEISLSLFDKTNIINNDKKIENKVNNEKQEINNNINIINEDNQILFKKENNNMQLDNNIINENIIINSNNDIINESNKSDLKRIFLI